MLFSHRVPAARFALYLHQQSTSHKTSYGVNLKQVHTDYLVNYEETQLKKRELGGGNWSCRANGEEEQEVTDTKTGLVMHSHKVNTKNINEFPGPTLVTSRP